MSCVARGCGRFIKSKSIQMHSSEMTQYAIFVKLRTMSRTNPNFAYYIGRMRIGSLCIFLFHHCCKERFHGHTYRSFTDPKQLLLFWLCYTSHACVCVVCVWVTIPCCSNKSLVIRSLTDSNSEWGVISDSLERKSERSVKAWYVWTCFEQKYFRREPTISWRD